MKRSIATIKIKFAVKVFAGVGIISLEATDDKETQGNFAPPEHNVEK